MLDLITVMRELDLTVMIQLTHSRQNISLLSRLHHVEEACVGKEPFAEKQPGIHCSESWYLQFLANYYVKHSVNVYIIICFSFCQRWLFGTSDFNVVLL